MHQKCKSSKSYGLINELIAIGIIYIMIIITPLGFLEYNLSQKEVQKAQTLVQKVKKVTVDIYKESEKKDYEIFKLQMEVSKLKSDIKSFEEIKDIKKDLDRTIK